MAMTALEIGNKLVKFCQEGKNLDSINTLYSDDIVSVEAYAPPGGADRTAKGIEAVRGKHTWWNENHIVHSAETYGPYPHGDDRFAVRFVYDITNKPSGRRMMMDEVAVFSVANGKVVREEFYYKAG